MPVSRWRRLEIVECRAEFKADETPYRFRWKGRWVLVDEIVKRWLQTGTESCETVYSMYEIKTELGDCLLRQDLYGWRWELKKN